VDAEDSTDYLDALLASSPVPTEADASKGADHPAEAMAPPPAPWPAPDAPYPAATGLTSYPDPYPGGGVWVSPTPRRGGLPVVLRVVLAVAAGVVVLSMVAVGPAVVDGMAHRHAAHVATAPKPAATGDVPLATTTTTVTATSDTVRAGLASVQGAALSTADLGGRWSRVDSREVPVATLNEANSCAPALGSANAISGWQTQFSLDLQPNGTERAHLLEKVIVQRSAQDAQASTAGLLETRGLADCLAADNLSSFRSAGIDATSSSSAPMAPPPGAAGAFRISISWTTNGGAHDVVYLDEVYLVRGPVRAHLEFQRCGCAGGPFPAASEETIVQQALTRLEVVQG